MCFGVTTLPFHTRQPGSGNKAPSVQDMRASIASRKAPASTNTTSSQADRAPGVLQIDTTGSSFTWSAYAPKNSFFTSRTGVFPAGAAEISGIGWFFPGGPSAYDYLLVVGSQVQY